jgi:uncharacterized protein (DUF1330 family)
VNAYVIAHLQQSPPHADVADYMERISGTFATFGGRFLVHATAHEVLEGEWPGHVVMIQFPDIDAAHGWWNSADYRAIAPLRSRHIDGDIIVVEGVPEQYDASHAAQTVRAAAG